MNIISRDNLHIVCNSSFRVEAKFQFGTPFDYVDHCDEIYYIPEWRRNLAFGFNTYCKDEQTRKFTTSPS